jgi:tetratricopeptide (TPR) repeat protein
MRAWPAAALLAALTSLCYSNACPDALVFDDDTALAQNPRFGGVERIPQLFGESVWEGVAGNRRLYRPLSMATLSVDRSVFGGRPRGYHATSVLLHVAATLVLFGLLCAMGAGLAPAFLAALVFGVHPIHTEAVDVAFNRSEILACLGVLAALWWLWRWIGSRPAVAWTGAAAFYFLALLSRESAATLPALAALCLGLLGPGDDRGRARRWVALVALVVPLAVYLGLRQWALGDAAGGVLQSVGSQGIGGAGAPLDRLSLVAATVRDYWRMLFWPWPLRASYEDYVVKGVAWAVAVHALLIGAAIALYKRFPAAAAGIAFFYVALLPSTRLFADPAVLAERFVYLPSAGLAITLAFGLAALMRRVEPHVPVAAVGAVVLIFGALTWHRNAAWHSRAALWEAEARASQDDWRVLLNLAQVRLHQQRYVEALDLCDRGVRIAPGRTAFHTNRALALMSLRRYREAEAAFAAAVRDGGDPAVWSNLARFYLLTGRRTEAEQAFERAKERERDEASRLAIEGERRFLCQGDVVAARASFESALALSPRLPAARRGLQMLVAAGSGLSPQISDE